MMTEKAPTTDEALILSVLASHQNAPKDTFIPGTPLYEGNKSQFVPGVGKCPAEIMLIGEAPGADEDAIGEPFVGRAGKILTECLIEAGLTRDQVWITNLVKERPPHNRPPTPKEIRAYADYLIEEIREVSPKVIVLLGAPALKTFTGKAGITRIHGTIYASQEFNCKMIPLLHPSYVLRRVDDVNVRKAFVNDLRRVIQLVQLGVISEVKKPTDYRLIDNIEAFNSMMDYIQQAPVVDFDLETTSKDPATGRIICTSFSVKECEAFVVPLFLDGKDYWDDQCRPTVLARLKAFFESDKPKCAHAGHLIDVPFLRAAGMDIQHYDYDTIIMHHLVDENERKRSLKKLAWDFTDMKGYEAEIDEWKEKLATDDEDEDEISFADIPFDLLWKYSAADADVAGRVRRILWKEIQEQKLAPLFTQISMPLQTVLFDVQQDGVKIDRPQLNSIREEYQRLAEEVTKELAAHPDTQFAREALGVEDINYSSSKQVQRVLFEALRIKPTKKSKKTGNPSADKEVLEELSKDYEIPRLIMKKRGYEHLVSYYGEKFESAIYTDGRIHTRYKVYGTETGRLSSSKPNLQNIPRADDAETSTLAARIRDIFIAEEGCILVDADYSQIEFRLLANYCRDPQMLTDIKANVDIHTQNANLVEAIAGKKVSRQDAKGLTYALIYGASEYRIADLFAIPVDQARDILNAVFRLYPGARRYHNEKITQAKDLKYVTNTFGRRRRLPGIESPDKKIRGHSERSAINSPIQGFAGDLIYTAMIRLHRIWKKNPQFLVKMIMQTHDSLTHECPENSAQLNQAIVTIYRTMITDIPGVSVPLAVDIKVGKSLGSMRKLSQDELGKIIGGS